MSKRIDESLLVRESMEGEPDTMIVDWRRLPSDVFTYIFQGHILDTCRTLVPLRTYQLVRTATVSVWWHRLVMDSIRGVELTANMTDASLRALPNLTYLSVSRQKKFVVTHAAVASMTKLRHLSLPMNWLCDDHIVHELPNLTSLDLTRYRAFASPLGSLTNLIALSLRNNDLVIQDLPKLTNLRMLDLDSDCKVVDSMLNHLVNLRELCLVANKSISDNGLSTLTALTNLNVRWNLRITDKGIGYLTNLETLSLDWSSYITDAGLCSLTRLTRLDRV